MWTDKPFFNAWPFQNRHYLFDLPLTNSEIRYTPKSSNEFFDYDAKYNGQVQEITPARLSPETAAEVAKTTSRIYDILHANGIIRIDYIITKDENGKDKVNMLEINTTPGMTVTSFIPQQVRAAGLDIKDVLSDIVENQF